MSGIHMRIDWKTVDFDWNHARAFLATAELGSLSAAAKALNSSQPTLSRQVNALEKQLKVALFERIGKGLELTPSGVELAECVKSMGNAAAHLSLTASGKSQLLEGSVCISASESMAAYELPALILKLRDLEPKITIELVASNASSDLKRREADIAIRSYRPEQLDLIAKKIRDDHFYLYAANSYLNSIENPQTLSDFNSADFIGPSDFQQVMAMLNQRGLRLTPENFPVTANNQTVYWELVKQGVGVGFIQDHLVQLTDTVEKVLPELGSFPMELWLVTHRELRTNKKIQYVFEFLSKELSNSS